ncbi:MAG: protein kinase [Candidatus Hydrogenedentales bacterium]
MPRGVRRRRRAVTHAASLHEADYNPRQSMSLPPGTRIGGYEIVAKLGEGGMGEVYRAHDAKLARDAALKILPEAFAHDAERLARFEREAKTLASLNHPHIALLYGFEQAGEVHALVMELVEGEDLSDRIRRGPIPLDEALPIARQIAEALEAAHEAGIVHRDLKPANVKVRDDGTVKVLDFGLAKAFDPASRLHESSPGVSQSPTITSPALTMRGVILGTAAYMAPEQAKGKAVDKRADIWAFGCVLYEMLTGERAFQGDDVADVTAAVITKSPDWSKLPPTTRIVELLQRCLQKDPRQRLRDIGDAKSDVVAAQRDGPTMARTSGNRPLLRAWLFATVVALAFVFGYGMRSALTPAVASIAAPTTEQMLTANPPDIPIYSAAISPDGRYLAYTDANGLFVRLIDTGETHAVSTTLKIRFAEVAWYPNNTHLLLTGPSPSGDTLSLYAVPAFGGTPSKLQDDAWRASVSPDGTTIAFLRARYPVHELWLMGANGERPRRFLSAGPAELFWQIGWSPDSRRVVYGVSRSAGPGRAIETRDLEGGNLATVLTDSAIFQNWRGILPFRWLSDGRLLYTRRENSPNETASSVWQIAIDPSGRVSGAPTRIIENVAFNVRDLSASADGRRIGFVRERNQPDVYVAALEGHPPRIKTSRRLTLDDRYDYSDGGWTTDGAVLFQSNRGASWDIYSQHPDAQFATAVVISPERDVCAVSSPDGQWILFGRGNQIMRAPRRGGPPETVMESTNELLVACGARPGARCVAGETTPDTVTYWEFDVMRGKTRELRRIQRETSGFVKWSLSMDGSRVAVVEFADRIRVAGLDDQSLLTIPLPGWTAAEFVAWSADGKGLFVQPTSASGRRLIETALLYVDLQGRISVLLKQNHEWYVYPNASPDGRFLAFTTMRFESNAWMFSR